MTRATPLNQCIVDTLNEYKASDISQMDVREMTDLTDNIIVCSATSKRHAATLADQIWVAAKANGTQPIGKEGTDDNEWILIDFGEIIVHIMLPKIRDYYQIENLWCIRPQDIAANED